MTTREEAIERIEDALAPHVAHAQMRRHYATHAYEAVAPLLAEAGADALNSAADDWPDQGIVSLWLRKRAESLGGRS